MIVISSDDEGHVPLVIVHRKTFAPSDKPVTPDEGDEGFAIVPVPEIRVQKPFPIAGVFPASVADEEQII